MKTGLGVLLLLVLLTLQTCEVVGGSPLSSSKKAICSHDTTTKYPATRALLPSVVDMRAHTAMKALFEKFERHAGTTHFRDVVHQHQKILDDYYYSTGQPINHLSFCLNGTPDRIGTKMPSQLLRELEFCSCSWMRRQLGSAVMQSFECELENQVDDPNLLPNVYLDKVKRLSFLARKYMLLAGGSAIHDQYDALFGRCVLQPLTKEAKALDVQVPKPPKAKPKSSESTPSSSPSAEESSPYVWSLVLCATVLVWGLILVLLRDYIRRNPSQWLPLLDMDPDEAEDDASQQVAPAPAAALSADQTGIAQAVGSQSRTGTPGNTTEAAAAVADLANGTLVTSFATSSSSVPRQPTGGDEATTITESPSGSLNHPD